MTMTTTIAHHLECDLCHADGGTTEGPELTSPRPSPDGWRQIRYLDICPACIAGMTLPEYLAIKDEETRKAREEQAMYDQRHREAREAKLAAAT